ncbi:MAG: LysE family translocator [Dinoroseobacter sp.]|nr:LysE family translocator [Dinoroseobacter sp.]
MALETWFAFVAATLALLVIPGPVVVLLLSQVFAFGRRIGFAAIAGVILGDLVAMSVSLAGAGAILASSATLFTTLKIGGGFYLVWLGIGLLRNGLSPVEVSGAPPAGQSAPAGGRMRAFRQAFFVTALNPKDIVFFVAFLPQFISASHAAGPQIATIVVTFLGLVLLTTSTWVFFATRLRRGLRHPHVRKFVSRTGAGTLVGVGALTALA